MNATAQARRMTQQGQVSTENTNRPARWFTGLLWLLLCAWSQPASAVDYDLNVGGQDWTTGTNWSPNGTPISGNSVQIDLSVTVSSPQAYGSSVDNSTFVGATAPSITINSGQSLTHVLGSTTTVSAGGFVSLSSAGTFNNIGTILDSGRFIVGYPVSGTQMNNTGTFEFVANGSNLELYSSGSNFINQSGGTVRVNLGAPAQLVRINGTVDTTAQYQHGGGNQIDFVQGTLVFAPPGGIGSTLNDAAFANIFGPINANSQLRLSGGLNSIALTGATDLSRVYLADDLTPLRAQSGGTTINITNPAGINFSPVVASFDLPTGRTMTNVAGSKLIASTATSSYSAMSGGGTFLNQGTLDIQSMRFIIGYPVGGTTLENQGDVNLTQNGSRIEFLVANSTFKNSTGGTVHVNLPSAANVASIYFGSPDNNGQYLHNGGNPIDFVQGNLEFAPSGGIGGTLTDTAFANLFGAINANSGLRLGGGMSINLTGATNLSRVTLGGTLSSSAYRAPTAAGLTISATGAGLNFTHTGYIDTGAGRTITNLTGSTLINLAGQDIYIGGSGTFKNEGTLKIGNRFLVSYPTGAVTFNNTGLVQFTNNGARVELNTSGTSFNNQAGGKIEVTLPNATDLARVSYNGGTLSFSNQGTIEVNKGIFRVEAPVTVSSWTNNTLTDGTYRVLANGNNSTLDLLASGTSAGSLTTIGTNAAVVMSASAGGVATFSQLGAISNLQGSFYVHGMSRTVASAMAVSGTLGGSGTIASPGTITFTGGTLDPAALNGGAGTLNLVGNLVLSNTTQLNFSLATGGIVGGVNDLVTVNGNLTLDGVLNVNALPGFGSGSYRLFNYTGSLTNLGLILSDSSFVIDTSVAGQVNLALVPEPATGLLLLMGVCLFRRRKQQA